MTGRGKKGKSFKSLAPRVSPTVTTPTSLPNSQPPPSNASDISDSTISCDPPISHDDFTIFDQGPQPKSKPQSATPHDASASATFSDTSEAQELIDKAKSMSIDPQLLLFQKMMSDQSKAIGILNSKFDTHINRSHSSSPPSDSSHQSDKKLNQTVLNSIGSMTADDDIFDFLQRFEHNMNTFNIHPNDWNLYLPPLLIGAFSKAYYNNINTETTFASMKTILLHTGGYSFTDCLLSFPLKFRPDGSKSLMQFFNLWKHKFEVIYREIPLSIETIHDVYAYCAEMTAIVAVLAGMPADARQSIMNNCYDDTNSLISECSATLSHSNISSLRSRPTHHYGNRQNTHYHEPRYQGNSQQHSHDTHYQNHHPRYPRFGNNHFRQSNSHSSPQHHQDQHQSQHRNYHQQNHYFQPYQQQNHYSQPHQQSNQPYSNHQTSSDNRDTSSVICYKCNQMGHFANNCPSFQQHQQQQQLQQQQQPRQQTPFRPTPVPRTRSHPTRLVSLNNSSDTPINCHSRHQQHCNTCYHRLWS